MSGRRIAGLLLRLGVTVGAIALAFSQVPAAGVVPLLRQMHWLPLLLGLALLHAAQILSALRTRYYLSTKAISMPIAPSLRLHYVGGLFNALLPGGTGGDAYKAWWVQKYHSGSFLNMAVLMVAGRVNGLWALGVLTCALALASGAISALHAQMAALLLAVMFAGTVSYHALARVALREPLAHQYRAGVYSFALQAVTIGCAFALGAGLQLGDHTLEYVVLFMLSCVLAMLPISIGGIGVRELALLHGSSWLGLEPQQGVALALSFSLINLSIPLVGAVVYLRWHPTPVKAQAA
ncbi:MAG: lysylphosphatidylglycerol synthase transmembrane domain-containing protein [Rickettsiales bacterium]